jgi:hypothetical protein
MSLEDDLTPVSIALVSVPSGQLYAGDAWGITATVTNARTGSLVTPAAVEVTVYPPGARKATPTVGPETYVPAKVSVGVYELEGVALSESGQWLAVLTSTGVFRGAARLVVSVAASTTWN